MVLRSQWWEVFSTFLIGVAFSVVLYLVMCLAHLLWFYMRPEDFWGFMYFLRIFLTILISFGVVVILAGFIIWGLYHLFSRFPVNFSWKKVWKGLGFVAVAVIMYLFNFFQMSYSELELYQKFADKYKHLENSKSFTAKKQYTQALSSAQQAYRWAMEDRTPSTMFPLTERYSKTTDARLLRGDEVFAATINYAYCLAQFDSLQNESIRQYEQALKIADEPLLAKRSSYKIFPLSALIEIYLKQDKLEKVDYYHIQLLKHIQHADVEDVEYFIECRELLASHALEVGDEKTAASIWISNHDLYQQAKFDEETSRYLELSLSAIQGNIIQNDLQEGGKLLKEIEKLANDKKKKSIYLEYLAIKGKYCDIAATENTGYEDLIDNGWKSKVSSLFNKKSVADKFQELASDCYEELLKRSEDKFGAGSLEHINVLFLYAGFNMKHGKYEEAEKIFQQVAGTNSKEAASDPGLLNRARLMSMVCQLAAGKPSFNIAIIKKIEEHLYKDASERLLYLTETERETFTSKLQEDIQLINAILLAANRDKNSTELYNNVLAFKNLILYSNAYWRNEVLNSNNNLFKSAYLQLLQEKDTSFANNLDIFVKEKQLIGKIRSLPGYRPYNPLSVTAQHIQQALEPGKSAVEYIAAPDLQSPAKPMTYFAVVVNHNTASPTIIKLCTEDTLTTLLNRGGKLKESIDSVYNYSLSRLQTLLIDPVIKATDSASYLYISLSGRLHQLSFTALLGNSHINFEILGSTRQVVDRTASVITTKKAVVLGEIDYNNADNVQYVPGNKKESGFKALPYSANEMFRIRSVLQTDKYEVSIASGKFATETAFRNLSGKDNKIIHLATHGFIDRTSFGQGRVSSDQLQLFQTETPMSKCKLVFAGANNIPHTAFNKNNDGIVTAQEIATLDFSGLELVVLSACESGLGELSNYEGIQGFQRAFTIAGARYTLVTLWSISDKHTAELMGYFYDNMIAGQDKSVALFNAQMKMKQLYKDPYYWAGYMLIRG
jgi:CHAT domain-containing protein